MVTRDSGIPLTWHAYPGDKPEVTQFPAMIDVLAARHAAICAASGQEPTEMTVGVQRRAELRRQLRPPGRDRPALRRVGARLRLRRPDRAARERPRCPPPPAGPRTDPVEACTSSWSPVSPMAGTLTAPEGTDHRLNQLRNEAQVGLWGCIWGVSDLQNTP